MPLTQSQLLQGNKSKGPVLSGTAQGVREGAGTKIADDGTISVFADTAVGLIKANNPNAFNEYVWPNGDGEVMSFLATDGSGNLSFQYPSLSSTVYQGAIAPTNALLGQLWYDTGARQIKIFENADGGNKWTTAHVGRDVELLNVSAEPAFTAGEGTYEEEGSGTPYTIGSAYCLPGTVVHFDTVITVVGLAPYQYVPIVDISAESNGYRFGVSNSHADKDGVLSFRPTFHDFPTSDTTTGFVATYQIGFSGVYVSASVEITATLSIESAGTITGVPQVGEELAYTLGSAIGGVPPYEYSWLWRAASNSEIIQENGDKLVIPPSMVGDQIYVELLAQDARKDKATGTTAFFPAPPEVIAKGTFPNTDILYPQFSNDTADTVWKDGDTALSANGCVEFTLDDITWGQGVRSIANGDTITTRWIDSSDCLGRSNGTTISGCIFNESYQDCEDLLIDKLPSPFSFSPKGDVPLSSVTTAVAITPVGYNATCYVTYSGTSSATDIEASLDGGLTWTNLPVIGTDTVPIEPGQSLTVRMTVGDQTETAYEGIINIGQGNVVQSAPFVATTAAVTVFSTVIPFPVTTYQGYDAEVAPSVVWSGSDGAMNLTATGCVEFSVNGGGWTQSSTAIATGNTLRTRWASSAGCGGAAHGLTISGTIDGSVGGRTVSGSLKLDRVPSSLLFSNVSDKAISVVSTSNTISLSGFNADAYVSLTPTGTTLTSVEASVNAGVFAAVPNLGSTSIVVKPTTPGNALATLQVRGTTGGSTSTNYTVALNAGTTGSSVQSSVWTARTSDIVKTVVQPSINSPVNGARNLNPNASSPSGITVLSSDYVGLNGAGAHQSSSWEIRKDSTGGATIVAVSNDTGNLVSYFLPLSSLNVSSTYFVRVKHHSADAVDSSWSNWSEFRTSDTFQLSWVRRFTSQKGVSVPTDLIWTGQEFVGCGSDVIIKSLDGKTWSEKKVDTGGWLFFTKDLYGITTDENGYIYVCGEDGVVIKTTNRGTSWDQISTVGASSVDQLSMTYGNGVFVSVGKSGVIQTSTNQCVTWNLRNSGTSKTLYHVIFAAGNFYAVGGNLILKSSNGITWNIVDVGASPDGRNFSRIAYLNGKFVAVRYESNYIATSNDGDSWSTVTVPSKFEYIAAGGIWFIAGGSASGDKTAVYSSVNNGVTWSQDYRDPSETHVHALAYSPELGRFAMLSHNMAAYSTK